MISRQPRRGDVIEWRLLNGAWTPFGVVSSVSGELVWCAGQSAPFIWCFGRDGCLGFNTVFRIVSDGPGVTMDDPSFN